MRNVYYLLFAFFVMVADQVSKWGVIEYIIKPTLRGHADAPIFAERDLVQHLEPSGFFHWLFTPHGLWPYVQIEVLPFFNWVMVWNKGVSFGMFNQGGTIAVTLLILLSFAITIWFLIWLFKTNARMQKIGIALVIGGALGNVFDRFKYGAVVDFLDFHIGDWHYPAFNIADSSIVVGVVILIIYAMFFENSFHK